MRRSLPAIALVAALAGPPALAQPASPSVEEIRRALTRGIQTPTTEGAAPEQPIPAPAMPGMSGAVRVPMTGPAPMQPPRAPAIDITVTFATGSASITPKAALDLANLGQALVSPDLAPYRFRIEGHTDTVGGTAMNQRLSEQRAAAVAAWLVSRYRVLPDRLLPVGLGEAAPLVPTPDNTPEARNRRVRIVNLGR